MTDFATAAGALADRARQLTGQYPPRTPERRAAAAVYVALTTTKTAAAARKAPGFADPVTRAAAASLLEELTRGDAQGIGPRAAEDPK